MLLKPHVIFTLFHLRLPDFPEFEFSVFHPSQVQVSISGLSSLPRLP